MENKTYTPTEYFDYIKGRRNTIDDKDLKNIYDNSLKLLEKYLTTGQTKGAEKLMFHIDTIEKEKEIIDLGINTFIYKDDIEEFIGNVSKNVVKIIELENYEREIPDEIVKDLALVKDKFTNFYVIFTDYTGKVERAVEKERRDKDPILFGTFEDRTSGTVVERFYYIGDWEDEYCDLTLDKMVAEMKEEGKDIVRNISTPKNLNDLREQLNLLIKKDNGLYVMEKASEKTDEEVKKEGFFSKIKTFITGKK